MDRIESQDTLTCELAKNAISILAYAERPLLAVELVHALSVDLDFHEDSGAELSTLGNLQSMTDSLGVYDPDLAPTVADVLAACAALIVHQPESDVIQLVHKTTREYLTSDKGRQKWFPQAQLTIAAICLVYTQAFNTSTDAVDKPFLDYAQKHYGHHILEQQRLQHLEGSDAHQETHKGSNLEPSSSFVRAQRLIDQLGLARMAQELSGMGDVLVLACEKNQQNFVRVLLSTQQYDRPKNQDIVLGVSSQFAMATCAIDRAMLAAVRNGHLELVDLLIKYGASPVIKADDGSSLLAIASTNGHHTIVDYLINHGYLNMALMQHKGDGP